MNGRSVSFGLALRAVRESLRLSQDAFGARVGVTRRTLTRWEIHDELPPVGQRKHLATSFPDAPAHLRADLVRSLELDDAFVASLSAPAAAAPLTPAPPSPSQGAGVDGAFLELCERLELAHGRLRAPLVEFLRRVEASGLSLEATRTRLEPKPAGKTRRGGE